MTTPASTSVMSFFPRTIPREKLRVLVTQQTSFSPVTSFPPCCLATLSSVSPLAYTTRSPAPAPPASRLHAERFRASPLKPTSPSATGAACFFLFLLLFNASRAAVLRWALTLIVLQHAAIAVCMQLRNRPCLRLFHHALPASLLTPHLGTKPLYRSFRLHSAAASPEPAQSSGPTPYLQVR